MSERKPLTLEDLRCMANKPYWHVGLREDSGAPHWSILDPLLAYHPEDYDYGKTWLAYAYEPPRLDRSAWEPCEYCRERDREFYKTHDYPGLCSFEVAQDGPDEIVVNAYNHNTPLTEDVCFSFPVLFCPKCGRPLTDAAWEMLEKRLEGNK